MLKKLVQRSYSLLNLGLLNANKPDFAKHGQKAEVFFATVFDPFVRNNSIPLSKSIYPQFVASYPLKYGDVIYG